MIRIVIAVVLLLVVWLWAGRGVTELADRILPGGAVPLATSPIRYDGGGLRFGELSLTFGGLDNLRGSVNVASLTPGRVNLSDGPVTFQLGKRTNAVDTRGGVDIEFVADEGDEVSLTSRTSVLSWPTPFEFKILGGASPWWKRYVYYQLLWKKPSGATLRMVWRYEQQYFTEGGWKGPFMLWMSHTGFLSVEIFPDEIVEKYIARTKGWPRSAYRIESRGPDGFAVIHCDDLRGEQPGAGKSVQVQVDRNSRRVIKEIGGQ